MPNKPQSRQCINVTNGKTSYAVLRRKGQPFPDVCDLANPKLDTIHYATVTDLDNSFSFKAELLPQGTKNGVHSLALKLVSEAPVGAGDPIDGLLGITLFIVNALPGGAPVSAPAPATDVPVDYISDPGGP